MQKRKIGRRDFLAAGASMGLTSQAFAGEEAQFKIGLFRTEVTPPLKHPLLAGLVAPAAKIEEPLELRGFVLIGGDKPLVVACIDWCEIRNESYDAWREAMAKAANTTPSRVLFSCIHQHDAPLDDLGADRLLRAQGKGDWIMDERFRRWALEDAAKGVENALRMAQPVTHIGTGTVRVEQVASNRKTFGPDGKPHFGRMSATADAELRARPEGTIDPLMRVMSFWNGSQPVVVLNSYSIHPMSYYGKGGVSVDFPGQARSLRQQADPKVFQIYGSGASGNTVAGKYNDGNPGNRIVLAKRLSSAMEKAFNATEKQPLKKVEFSETAMEFEPRDSLRFTRADLENTLKNSAQLRSRALAALGLSWRDRCAKKIPVTLPAINFGGPRLLLLPGESYVEFQLFAQSLLPKEFVLSLGYGECGTGYIPTDKHFKELDGNLNDWCWVNPGAEKILKDGIQKALLPR